MTAIDPFADVRVPTTGRTAPKPDDQMGTDTFLKLLVAQLRYQNPLAPSDGTEFLTQTAQFTMVERLQEIQDHSAESARANDVLAAASMIGRSATFNVASKENAEPVPTTKMTLGGSLSATAAPGAKVNSTVEVYTSTGTPIQLELQLTRLPDADGQKRWEMRLFNGSTQLENPRVLTFDEAGELTSGDVVIPATTLDQIVGTAGSWPGSGIAIVNAAATDADRLRVAEGGSTFSVREQNGGDGTTLTGIVTGILVDPDQGVLVRIGEHAVKLQDITAVTSPT